MENKEDYKIPLGELLAILKTSGYEVSVERILEIETVLLSSPVIKWSPQHLKFIIAPLLARNEEDQKNIYKIIDSFIAAKSQINEKKQLVLPRWLQNRQLILKIKMAGFLLILFAGLLVYFFQNRDAKKKSSINIPSKENLKPDTIPPAKKQDRVNETVTRKATPVPPSAQDNPITTEYNGKTIDAAHLNINLQVSVAFGLGFGAILYYIIFIENRKRMALRKKKSKEEANFLSDEVEDKSGLRGQAKDQWEQTIIQFQEKDFLIQKSREFTDIRTNLKKPAFVECAELDVKASAYATARSAGFPTLVFGNDWKERKYLFLVDNNETDGHIHYLLNYVIRYLTSNKIPVNQYTYTTDVTILKDSSNKTAYLKELSSRLAGYHLIITGDCHSFFNPADLVLNEEYANIFRRWESRSIITPVPLPDWSYREEQLQNNQFQIVPAEINAIKLLTKAITENSLLKRKQLEKQIKDSYSVSGFGFQSADEVKTYLNNEDLFQLVCSLAVYPKLNWSLSLALFSAIMKKKSGDGQTQRLTYDTLLKISRIPWLHKNKLDDSIRLQLFNYLNPEMEIIARETILELLNEIRPSTHSPSLASQELDVQYKLNSFFLFANDPNKYRQYADVKNEITVYWDNLKEWALKERVNSRVSGLMPQNNEGERTNVNEFVLEEEKFEKVNVTFLRIVLLTLPAIVLYILFSVFRPGFIYVDTYEKVSFLLAIKKDAACQKKLTHVIVRNDKPYTQQLKMSDNMDYIQVNDVEYDRSVGFSLVSADSTIFNFYVKAIDSAATVSVKCY